MGHRERERERERVFGVSLGFSDVISGEKSAYAGNIQREKGRDFRQEARQIGPDPNDALVRLAHVNTETTDRVKIRQRSRDRIGFLKKAWLNRIKRVTPNKTSRKMN